MAAHMVGVNHGSPGAALIIPEGKSMKVEGHWRQSHADDHTGLPFPLSEVAPWKGQQTFLVALAKKESVAEAVQYRGFSYCRICDKLNGSVEFELAGWQWAEGLRHYVKVHNVLPTKEFIDFVLLDPN